MIYLKLTSGLCNRLLALDSLVSICEKHNCRGTVLWLIHAGNHSSFYELFEEIEGINADIRIDTHYPISKQFLKYKLFSLSNILSSESFIEIYRCLKYFNLNSKKTGTDITNFIDNAFRNEIRANEDMSNNELTRFHRIFCKKIELKMSQFAKNSNTKPIFIEMFTRFFWNDNKPYSYLKPRKELQKEIDRLSEKFKNTTGLHIRRSDHVHATRVSSTDKFIKIIQEILKEEPTTNFFLASDSFLVKEELVEEFGKDKILTQQLQHNIYNRYHRNNAKSAVIDLFCLSKTKKIYGSSCSTFSLIASDIGRVELSVVK